MAKDNLIQIIRSAIIDGWMAPLWRSENGKGPIIIMMLHSKNGIEYRIEFQKDRDWCRDGGRLCVNLNLVDGAFNEYMGFQKGTYIDHTRLGILECGRDEWYDINVGNADAVILSLLSRIGSVMVPIADNIHDCESYMRVFTDIGIGNKYIYALYKDRKDLAIPYIVEMLNSRDASDMLMESLKRFGMITDGEISKIKIIQIQSTADQKLEISQFIRGKGWIK